MNLKASGRTASAGHTWWYNLMTEFLKAPSLGGPTSPMYIKYTKPTLAIYFLLHLPALDKFHLSEKLQSTWATSTLLTTYRHRKISLIFIPKRSIFFFKRCHEWQKVLTEVLGTTRITTNIFVKFQSQVKSVSYRFQPSIGKLIHQKQPREQAHSVIYILYSQYVWVYYARAYKHTHALQIEPRKNPFSLLTSQNWKELQNHLVTRSGRNEEKIMSFARIHSHDPFLLF